MDGQPSSVDFLVATCGQVEKRIGVKPSANFVIRISGGPMVRMEESILMRV